MNFKEIISGIIIYSSILGIGTMLFAWQTKTVELEEKISYKKNLKKELSPINIAMSNFNTIESNFNSDNKEIKLNTAIGITKLTAYNCAVRASEVFNEMGFSKINIQITLKNWKKVQESTENSARYIQAFDDKNIYSIFCKPFNSDLVIFNFAGSTQDKMNKLWKNFYKKKKR